MADSGNQLVVAQLLDWGLIPAIKEAWGTLGLFNIDEDDIPKTFQELPFVSINWMQVEPSFNGLNAAVGQTDHEYQFEIILYFKTPQAMGTIENKLSRLKLAYANALINILQSTPGFAPVPNTTPQQYLANMPLVSRVNPKGHNPPFDGSATLSCWFTCHTCANWASGVQ